MYKKSDYFYDLPEKLIAQNAVNPHHNAKMMVIDRSDGSNIAESDFWNLDKYLESDRVLFFNNSRVLPARIRLKNCHIENIRGEKSTLQAGEILFCQKLLDGTFEGLVRPGKKFPIGTKITFRDGHLKVIGLSKSGRIFQAVDTTIEKIMTEQGELPLPPYITYEKEKEKDYQTVFAQEDGSVAAPTASLHFTKELLEKLPQEKIFVTLHVGLGTFQSVDTEDIRDYQIHEELAEIRSELFISIARFKRSGKKIVAIGTTVCRTLESLSSLWKSLDKSFREEFDKETRDYWDKLSGDTSIISHWVVRGEKIFFHTSVYIYPGYQFGVIDELITNFHLPESSLLMLVSALIGKESLHQIYQYAIEQEYRFFSFGDGMYIRA